MLQDDCAENQTKCLLVFALGGWSWTVHQVSSSAASTAALKDPKFLCVVRVKCLVKSVSWCVYIYACVCVCVCVLAGTWLFHSGKIKCAKCVCTLMWVIFDMFLVWSSRFRRRSSERFCCVITIAYVLMTISWCIVAPKNNIKQRSNNAMIISNAVIWTLCNWWLSNSVYRWNTWIFKWEKHK